MSHSNVSILAFSADFCHIKIELSGNDALPQALDFQILAKIDHFFFLAFLMNFLSIQNVNVVRFVHNVE